MARSLIVLVASAALAPSGAGQLALPQHLVNFSEETCGAGLENAASSVASIGDVDGDGLPDIVVGSHGTTTAAGAGAGRVLVLSAADRSVLFSIDGDAAGDGLGFSVDGAGDVDGDGTPDFVYGIPRWSLDEFGSSRVHSGADGALLFDLQAHPLDAAFGYTVSGGADVNGDGRPDVITFADCKEFYTDSYVSVHSGADGSMLHQYKTYSPFTPAPSGAFGDLDGDGCDEFLIGGHNPDSSSSNTSLFLRSGASGIVLKSFINQGWGGYAGDYNDDGTPDLLFHGGTLLSGHEWRPLVEFDGGGTPALLGDLDGDGVKDYSLGDRVHTGTGGPPVFVPSSTRRLSAAGDIDGDGALDILGVPASTSTQPGEPGFHLLLSRPVSLIASLAPAGPPGAERVLGLVGDIDGDGHPDLIVGRESGQGHVLVLSGDDFATVLDIPPPAGATDFGAPVAGAGDVDADGVPDLVVGGGEFILGQGFVGAVYVCSGADGHVLLTLKDTPANVTFGDATAGAGDVNADGFADVFVGKPGGPGSASVFAGPAGGLLWKATGTQSSQLGTAAVPAGDANGDGFGDLFVGAPNSKAGGFGVGVVRVLSGADGAMLQAFPGVDPQRSFGATLAAVGDLDGDGVHDVAVGSALTYSLSYARSQVTVLSGASGAKLFDWWTYELYDTDAVNVIPALAAGDVDGDGLADVVIGARTEDGGGLLDVRSGAQGGSLLSAPGVAGQQLASAVLAADLDGDGRADAITDSPGVWPEPGEIRAYSLPFLAQPWTYAGHGLAGSMGLPQLTGTGEWRPGELITLQLADADANAPTLLVAGLQAVFAPLKGGTLVPSPDVVFAGPPTNAAGGWTIDAHAPAVDVPALLLQALILDAAAPHGLAASNALLVELD